MSGQVHWYQFKGLGFIFIAVAVIRYFLEYVCQVFHHSLSGYLSFWWDWANSSYIPLTYQQEGTWSIAGIPFFIGDRHENLSSDLFQNIEQQRPQACPSLLPPRTNQHTLLLNKHHFNAAAFRTNRYKTSFIISHSSTDLPDYFLYF